MTLRERIADWISGGEIVAARNTATHYRSMYEAVEGLASEYDERLDRIAAQETPGANATVRRMARIARGEE